MSLSEAISSVHPGDPILDPTASLSFVMPGRKREARLHA
jgi:hypothetical protein